MVYGLVRTTVYNMTSLVVLTGVSCWMPWDWFLACGRTNLPEYYLLCFLQLHWTFIVYFPHEPLCTHIVVSMCWFLCLPLVLVGYWYTSICCHSNRNQTLILHSLLVTCLCSLWAQMRQQHVLALWLGTGKLECKNGYISEGLNKCVQ